MCITVAPMINLVRAEIVVLDDGWRVVTADGSLRARFENTILGAREGAEILTTSSL